MSRTALLQPAHLDHVEGRLALLAQKMNDVAERKAALLDDAEKQSRLESTFLHLFQGVPSSRGPELGWRLL